MSEKENQVGKSNFQKFVEKMRKQRSLFVNSPEFAEELDCAKKEAEYREAIARSVKAQFELKRYTIALMELDGKLPQQTNTPPNNESTDQQESEGK